MLAKVAGDGMQLQNYELARTYAEEGLAMAREVNVTSYILENLTILGEIARCIGDYSSARTYYEETLQVARELDSPEWQISILGNLGFVSQHEGNYDVASELFRQSLRLAWETSNRTSTCEGLTALAGIAAIQRQPQRAARLFGAAEAVFEATNYHMSLPDQLEYNRNLATARPQLDEATWEAAWQEGLTMSLEQAIAYALAEPADD